MQLMGQSKILGNQPHSETVLELGSVGYIVRRIQNEYPGGYWRTCLHRNYIALAYDCEGDDNLWLVRMEMDVPTKPIVRVIAVYVGEIAFINDPGGGN